ncbi:MAG: PH domain-containing protein [Prevotella sp.]|nr:PH domain-containing protein [Prevotella sp.]
MGYIEKHLMQDEKVVSKAKLHWIVYFGPGLMALLAIGLLFISDFSWLLRICLMLGVWLCALIWAVAIDGGKQYVVTTRRIIFKHGIIKRSSLELLLRKCEGIKVEQSIMGRILGYGTVLVTTGEATNRYDYIRHPVTFSTCINQQIDNLKTTS